MAKSAKSMAKERFLQFMIAEIEGDRHEADQLAKEMLDLGEMSQSLEEVRRRLRECENAEERQKIRQSFLNGDLV